MHVADRDIWRIALPMILSNVSVPLLGLVDTAVVGHLDHSWYLGAVAVGAAVFSFIYNGLNFLRMGTTGVAAQSHGADDDARVRRSLIEALLVAAVLGAALLLLSAPLRELALTLVAPEVDVAREAAIYIDIRIWSAPAVLATSVIVGWFLGLQDARVPLVTVLVVNVTNIVLDLVFVIGLGMTTNGVALASVIAEYLGVAVALTFAVRRYLSLRGALDWSALVSAANYRRYFSVNGNILIRTLALMFALFFVTAQSARLGTVVLAANAILLNLQYLTSYLLDGLAHAAEALVGKAIGRRDRAMLNEAVRKVMLWSIGFATVLTLIYAVGGNALIGLLTDIDAVRATAATFLIWLIASPLISVGSFVYDGIFIGATRAREMRNVMVLALIAVFLPAWWLTRPLGNHGLWLAFTLFMAARSIGMYWYYERIPRSLQAA
ncbi:MAG: MATE family efflux transporter [Pseudomonadota bacterium]